MAWHLLSCVLQSELLWFRESVLRRSCASSWNDCELPFSVSGMHDSLTRYPARNLTFMFTPSLLAPRQHVHQFYLLNVSQISPLFSLLASVSSPAIIISCLDNGSSFLSLCLHPRSFSIPQGSQRDYLKCQPVVSVPSWNIAVASSGADYMPINMA